MSYLNVGDVMTTRKKLSSTTFHEAGFPNGAWERIERVFWDEIVQRSRAFERVRRIVFGM